MSRGCGVATETAAVRLASSPMYRKPEDAFYILFFFLVLLPASISSFTSVHGYGSFSAYDGTV